MITARRFPQAFGPPKLRRVAALATTSVALLGCALGSHTTAWAQTTPTIPDTLVTDQDGRQVRFYTDLVRGKKVLIHVMYTTCTAYCPTSERILARELQRLGNRLGRDIFFISITLDPQRDTPARLRSWAAHYGARPGWTLVTGNPRDMERLLRFLRFPPNKVMHGPVVLLGNDATRQWRREPVTSRQLSALIDRL